MKTSILPIRIYILWLPNVSNPIGGVPSPHVVFVPPADIQHQFSLQHSWTSWSFVQKATYRINKFALIPSYWYPSKLHEKQGALSIRLFISTLTTVDLRGKTSQTNKIAIKYKCKQNKMKQLQYILEKGYRNQINRTKDFFILNPYQHNVIHNEIMIHIEMINKMISNITHYAIRCRFEELPCFSSWSLNDEHLESWASTSFILSISVLACSNFHPNATSSLGRTTTIGSGPGFNGGSVCSSRALCCLRSSSRSRCLLICLHAHAPITIVIIAKKTQKMVMPIITFLSMDTPFWFDEMGSDDEFNTLMGSVFVFLVEFAPSCRMKTKLPEGADANGANAIICF